MAKQRKNFMQNSLILIVAVVLVKVIGALFKIPLGWILGDTGFGYFTSAYNMYMPVYVIAMAGFPAAVSRFVAAQYSLGNYRNVRRILQVGVRFFVVTGTLGFLILFFGAGPLSSLVSNEPAKYAVMALAPTVFFCCVMSAYRGYYNGLANMYPTAISQVIEALGKLLVGYTAAALIMHFGMQEFATSGTVFHQAMESAEQAQMALYPFAAAGAIGGVSVGSIFACAFVILRHKIVGDTITAEQLVAAGQTDLRKKTIFKTLIRIGMPIALGAIVMQLSSVIDLATVTRQLGAALQADESYIRGIYGYGAEIAVDQIPNKIWGCYGIALTFFNLIPTIAQPFGLSAMPGITAAYTKHDQEGVRRNVESVMRITLLIVLPCGIGLSVMADPVLSIIYPNQLSMVAVVAPLLNVLAIAAIFAGLCQSVNSMLQSVGKYDLPVKIMAVGALAKLITNFLLVAIPQINIMGAAISTILCYLIIFFGGFIALMRATGAKLSYGKLFGKPLLSALCCGATAYLCFKLLAWLGLSLIPVTAISILAAVVVYVVMVFLTGSITKSEIYMLPKGEKIAKTLEKWGWIR